VINIELVVNVSEFTKLKKKYSLNMTQLAEALSVSRTQLWRIMNKQCNPGEQFIAGFKQAFPKENFDNFFLLKQLQQSDTRKT
jgi:transcriptional regulator with XRE-family HTH domain